MPNITLSIDQSVLRKVKRMAVDRDTTLTAMVREYLEQLAAREEMRIEDRIEKLRAAFDAEDVEVGPITWTREDLHGR